MCVKLRRTIPVPIFTVIGTIPIRGVAGMTTTTTRTVPRRSNHCWRSHCNLILPCFRDGLVGPLPMGRPMQHSCTGRPWRIPTFPPGHNSIKKLWGYQPDRIYRTRSGVKETTGWRPFRSPTKISTRPKLWS